MWGRISSGYASAGRGIENYGLTLWNGGRKMRKPLDLPTMQAFFITIANRMMDRLSPELIET
jgi:hypothetical protein